MDLLLALDMLLNILTGYGGSPDDTPCGDYVSGPDAQAICEQVVAEGEVLAR